MKKARIAVEWSFGDVVAYFAFMDFKKNLKLGLQPIGKMYRFCVLLKNARACLYGNLTSVYFDLTPPSLGDYFR